MGFYREGKEIRLFSLARHPDQIDSFFAVVSQKLGTAAFFYSWNLFSSNVLHMDVLISSMIVSSFFDLSADTGGMRIMRTGPGDILPLPFLIIFPVPIMATGTIGAPDRMGSNWLPFLNGPILPSSERVPSGKMTMELPDLSLSTVVRKDL